jgi:hypothetical protein
MKITIRERPRTAEKHSGEACGCGSGSSGSSHLMKGHREARAVVSPMSDGVADATSEPS